MQMVIQNELAKAYARGIQAGWHTGAYEGPDVPECPYPPGELNEAWHDGFGDGTEDYIAYQESE